MATVVSQADYNDISVLTYSTGVGQNMPSPNGYHLVIPLCGNGTVLGQIAIDCYSASTVWYFRSKTASVWREWKEICDNSVIRGTVTAGSNISGAAFNAFRCGKSVAISYYFIANGAIQKNATLATLPSGFIGSSIAQWNASTAGTKRLKIVNNTIQADEDIPNGTVCQGQITYVAI